MHESEAFISRGLEIYKEVLGNNHFKTINAKENLAGVYLEGNKFNKSIKILKEVLRLRNDKFGEEHPDNANTYNQLAISYSALDLFDEAESSLLKAFVIAFNILPYKFLKNDPIRDNTPSEINSFALI